MPESIFFFLHLDSYLAPLVQEYGTLSYVILFVVVFCETGLVFMPFLPGDSLIFVSAALAGGGVLNPWLLWLVFFVASVLGDSVNYSLGRRFGRRMEGSRWLKPEHLEKTRDFYARYGKKTIILARFIPVIRTIAPFVAGMGKMDPKIFLSFNVIGGFVWVSFFTLAGSLFGKIPWVKENLEMMILLIIFLSLLPPVFEWWREKKRGRSGGT